MKKLFAVVSIIAVMSLANACVNGAAEPKIDNHVSGVIANIELQELTPVDCATGQTTGTLWPYFKVNLNNGTSFLVDVKRTDMTGTASRIYNWKYSAENQEWVVFAHAVCFSRGQPTRIVHNFLGRRH